MANIDMLKKVSDFSQLAKTIQQNQPLITKLKICIC